MLFILRLKIIRDKKLAAVRAFSHSLIVLLKRFFFFLRGGRGAGGHNNNFKGVSQIGHFQVALNLVMKARLRA